MPRLFEMHTHFCLNCKNRFECHNDECGDSEEMPPDEREPDQKMRQGEIDWPYCRTCTKFEGWFKPAKNRATRHCDFCGKIFYIKLDAVDEDWETAQCRDCARLTFVSYAFAAVVLAAGQHQHKCTDCKYAWVCSRDEFPCREAAELLCMACYEECVAGEPSLWIDDAPDGEHSAHLHDCISCDRFWYCRTWHQ